MHLNIRKWLTRSLIGFYLCLITPVSLLAESATNVSDRPIMDRIFSPLYENIGHLILTVVAIWLAYRALQGDKELRKRQLNFEEQKFKAEEEERVKLTEFRKLESRRFAEPAADLANHLAEKLIADPHWAYRALEAAKLLPYKDTLFDERTQHFRKEKQELAIRFTPYLLARCEHIITNLNQDVWLIIDAGTTLLPFFEIIGRETAKLSQKGKDWLKHLHLATNNLPGIEQIIKTGRRIPADRYSDLAIDDCFLLPGIPVPLFAAVAGNLTNKMISDLRKNPLQYTKNQKEFRESTFIALIVGNWIRIRDTPPRCPVPMARGVEHLGVKQAIIENADEIFVVSPLGKIFVDAKNKAVNEALGFKEGSPDAENAPYIEVKTDYQDADTNEEVSKAIKIKLVTTTRPEGSLLYRHSNRVEDALGPTKKYPQYSVEQFAQTPIDALSYMIFPFPKPSDNQYEEFTIEFPHYHTRTSKDLLEMFSVKEP